MKTIKSIIGYIFILLCIITEFIALYNMESWGLLSWIYMFSVTILGVFTYEYLKENA